MADRIKCSCGSDNVAIFPCVGASNVGQISNKVAIELANKDVGTMMCTVGIGGHVPGLVKSAEGCDHIIVIDGCPLSCAKKTLEHACINVDKHIILTELDIKKDHDLNVTPDQVKDALKKVMDVL
ncbi:MAG: zinc-binding protein [Methanosarcinaceae archaeon]|nr:zinc-binding protein [Methanosarcinaceae archaeon]